MNQKVIVTIDTEGHDGKDPISKLILGQTEKGRYGIEYIMDILDEFDVKALFFVDFAEAWDYGEEKVRNVVDIIKKRGHDVGVHIHPDHMADKKRLFLWEYSREEQYDIIKKCTELYVKLVGEKPLSFRAGKYGANLDTLDILCELGYKYDFSLFYHQKWCGIEPAFTINTPCLYKSLVEYPVTMHTSFVLGRLKREDKIDIEGMTEGELKYALNQVLAQNYQVVVTLFFHSFSLLNWRHNPDSPNVNKRNINKIKHALNYVKNNRQLQFIDETNLHNIILDPESMRNANESDIIWDKKLKGIYYTIIKAFKIAKYNTKARCLVLGLIITVIITLALGASFLSSIIIN